MRLEMENCRKNKKRSPQQRVFVNRSLRLDKIDYYGFDMDHTLAVYVTPEFDELCFQLALDALVKLGYPESIRDFKYDPAFTLRGLWLDKKYGTLLKVDPYGNILKCSFGRRFLRSSEISKIYPNNFVTVDKDIFILNTLFNSPESYIYACVVHHYVTCGEFDVEKEGVRKDNVFMSFRNIATDIRAAIDGVHSGDGHMKSFILDHLDKYVVKDMNLPILFQRMKDHGKKIFLLTNSDYKYTNGVMTYLFDFEELENKDWKSYFDLIVVDAQKPRFFAEGTSLRQVNPANGTLHVGTYVGPMVKGQVYSGGSAEVITALFGAKGRDVLYFGDHIHGDVIRSKKLCGWRTFLIVPEIAQEITIWVEEKQKFDTLDSLNADLTECYLDLDSARDVESEDLHSKIKELKKAIREVSHDIDIMYGQYGSLFRSGSRQTFFAAQTVRYADLYAASFINLINYPFSYFFQAPHALMPHEQTIDHGDRRSAFLPHGNSFVLKDTMLTNTLTSPMVARQQPDDVDGIDRCKSPEVSTEVSIPKGKVLLRRQTLAAVSTAKTEELATGDAQNSLGIIGNDEGDSDSSSDTEE
ncbi:cytosolic purine 5'-nucleotidase-like isoform X2 [Convolutriloba macropyga]|uniref:cytosolic purine 5'-nucleotidase-like isoform X2 n=1 Tax=Convolutriloba macropyga TaxID=536237 RepID=UPI003F5205EC